METEMQISPAKEEDAPDLANLVNRCNRGKEALEGWTTDAGYISGNRTNPVLLLQDMKEPGIFFLKCFDISTGELVGCVYLKVDKDGKDSHTGMLSVLPKMQSRGIGRLLMDEVEAMAKEKGCTSISMQAVSSRDTLIALYNRRGFQDTGIRRPFLPEGGKYGVPSSPLEFTWMKKIL